MLRWFGQFEGETEAEAYRFALYPYFYVYTYRKWLIEALELFLSGGTEYEWNG